MTPTCLVAQIVADSIAVHDSNGATIKSTPSVFKGCAASNNRIPSEEGRALAPPDAHEREEEEGGGKAVPARQAGQGPEHSLDVNPARLPYFPAGQAIQMEAPASEYVPGGHSEQAVAPG